MHPAISATAKALRKAKPGPDEVVRASGHGCCGIEVGAASLERTIAVLDSIARALDARGLKVEPIDNSMRVALPPDSLTFALAEQIEKRNHVPTMEELAKEEQLRKNGKLDSESGPSIGNARIQNSTSSAPANSASRSRINMSEDFVQLE